MKLQDFHVEIADWAHDDQRAALLDIRHEVFAQEQGDASDANGWHVLARSDAGQPIGCGRLTPQRTIDNMAVRQPWRGRGVGAALLRQLVALARAQGWVEVTLDAPPAAAGFYERAGFGTSGASDGAHCSMRLALPAAIRPVAPARDIGALPATSRNEIATSRLQLLREARHRLALYLPVLTADQYASDDEWSELRRIASSGRNAQVRILLHDPDAALRDGHRLITLAQRLPGTMQIRTPVEETDLACTWAYLLNDAGGYLLLHDASRPHGRAASRDRVSQAPLQQHFDTVWERSERARTLQLLDI